ncbi:phosphotransferase family protein [Dactylosporangium sp. CA-092794]|uniref:phosphotransferase family protein n=1 Tax=Dactylosporangium sp. CA-092794 TaxID=3239929 RepID=UPI003D907595
MAAPAVPARPATGTEVTGFVARAQAYLRRRLDRPDLTVTGTCQATGGGSRLTRSVTIEWTDHDGRRQERLVFRLDPPAGILDSNRHLEFEMYSAFHPVEGVPVPEPILVEDDPQHLGMTFLLMRWLPGSGSKAGVMRPEYDAVRPRLGRQMFEILGTIARTPVEQLHLPYASRNGLDWRDRLDHWHDVMAGHALGPTPVFDAVIRYLRRNPPPPAPTTVVHGDFRIGNYLYTAEDGIQGVVDWELSHLGDPHEDLAYACLPYWRPMAHPDLIAGAITEPEAIGIWERTSGLVASREALRIWTMFAYIRLAAILSTGAYFVARGEATEALQTATGITEPPRFQLLAAELIEVADR